MIPQLTSEFSVPAVEMGLLMSIALVPGVFLSLPSGWLLNKCPAKKIGATALVCIAVASALTAVSNSFIWILFARFILGLGGTLIYITNLAIVSQWFAKKDLGKAMGLFGASIPLITLITFPAASLATANFGWRSPFYISTLLAVMAIALFLAAIKNGPNFECKAATQGTRKDYLNLELWKIGLICLCVQGTALSFTTWAPTLFTEFARMPNVEASFLASLASLPSIFLFPVFGYLSDRLEKRRLFIILGPLLMTLAFISLASGLDGTVAGSVLFMGIASTMVLPVLNVMPPEILGHKAGIGFGILSICGTLGGILSVLVIGLLVDAANSLAVSLLGMGAFSGIAAAIALTLKTK